VGEVARDKAIPGSTNEELALQSGIKQAKDEAMGNEEIQRNVPIVH
jgi:hypothetical protein